jgi:hypothetical protein
VVACSEAPQATLEGPSPVPPVPPSPPEGFLLAAQQAASGKYLPLWQALPASYQRDVHALARAAYAAVPESLWDNAFALLEKASEVLTAQSAFVANARPLDRIRTYLGAAALLAKSPLRVHGTFDAEAFFSKLAGPLATALQLPALGPPGLVGAKYSIEKIENDTAMIRVAWSGGSTTEETFYRIEDKWVWGPVVEQWDGWMEAAASAIGRYDVQPSQAMKLATAQAGLSKALTELGRAKTQAEFNKSAAKAMRLATKLARR